MKNNVQTSEDNRDSGVLSSPLSFLRSGGFYWLYAGLYYRGGNGLYWSLRSSSTTRSNDLYFHYTGLDPQDGDSHGYGFAVRCVFNHQIEREGQLFRGCPDLTREDEGALRP